MANDRPTINGARGAHARHGYDLEPPARRPDSRGVSDGPPPEAIERLSPMSPRSPKPEARPEAERSAVLSSPQPVCAVCGAPLRLASGRPAPIGAGRP
jgi:hypothetical protein